MWYIQQWLYSLILKVPVYWMHTKGIKDAIQGSVFTLSMLQCWNHKYIIWLLLKFRSVPWVDVSDGREHKPF